MKEESRAIRNQIKRSHFSEHSAPVYMTSSFVFSSAEEAAQTFAGEREGLVYSRYDNPNTDEFALKIKTIEDGEDALSTASGMAAVFSSFCALLKSGDHIVACKSLFASTHQIISTILPRWGIEYSYVDIKNPGTWAGAFRDSTKILYIETPTNPALDLVDIKWAAELAAANNALLLVDNSFATPCVQKPLRLGADLVLVSATKFIDGQGRAMGGAVCGKKELIEDIRTFTKPTGPTMSPFNAWILAKSVETLSVRMERHCGNAHKIAEYLESLKDDIKFVKYPYLESHPQYDIAVKQMKSGGALLSFELAGGIDQGAKFLNSLKMLSITPNLGDSRTTVTHPASTTQSRMSETERLEAGVTPGLIRLSAGLEDVDDIIEDISQAIGKSRI